MSLPIPALRKLPFLPVRRVIAIDSGSQAIKVLLVERALGRPRILKRRSIDLPEEGLLSPEEFNRHLREVLDDLGPHPIAIPLPQTQTMSVVVDVTPGDDVSQRRQIEDEIVRVSGLSEAAVVFDQVRLRAFDRHANPFWVTLCREPEISARYDGLGLDPEDLCDVTTEANALMAAYRSIDPQPAATVVVDLGASRTVVAIFHQGQGVHASAFPSGSATFTTAIAAHRHCSTQSAENLKRSINLLAGSDVIPDLRTAVDAWQKEVVDIVREWLAAHRGLELKAEAFRFILGGGGARQPGLIDHLRRLNRIPWTLWPVRDDEDRQDQPPGSLAVAFGTAAQALGVNPQPASLLPAAQRETWLHHRRLQVLQSINAFFMAIVLVLLLAGTWQKYSLLRTKQALLRRTEEAVEKAGTTVTFARRLMTQYERQQPVLESQRFTFDALRTMALLQQARSNRTYWFVSFADPISYYTVPQQGVTNPAPPMTNLLTGTNAASLRQGFIAELCIPEEGEAQRRILSTLVTNLKSNPLFANVDLLSADRMRPIVSPDVIISNRLLALSLEVVTNVFTHPPRLIRPPANPPPAPRESRLPARPTFRSGERPATNEAPSFAPP